MTDLSAVVAYITAVSVVGAVVSLIWENRAHLEKCPVCGRPKKDNAVYAHGARHPFYYEHHCRTPEGVTTVTSFLYGRVSTISFWYGLENGTVLEGSDVGADIWGAMWVKHEGKVFSLQEWREAQKICATRN